MDKDGFYTVKKFANTLSITPKTLKFYEQEKIFAPAYIDPNNGYRYYHYSQLSDFTLILAMKNLGFTVAEMRTFLNDGLTLEEKYNRLTEQKKILDELIDTFSVYIEGNRYKAQKKTVPAHYELKIPFKAKNVDNILNEHTKINKLLPNYKLCADSSRFFYIEYLDSEFRMTDISLSFNYIVKKTTREGVVFVPEQSVVSVLHLGEYDTLPAAYEFLYTYCSENKLEICGYPQEYYLSVKSYPSNAFSKPLADIPLTELRFPINI